MTMQHYIGTKLVQAEPEARDGNPGYKIIYPDGYNSWSPQDTFEQAYVGLGDLTGQSEFLRKLIAERGQIADQLKKIDHLLENLSLSDGIVNEAGHSKLLEQQKKILIELSDVLKQRIDLFVLPAN